MFRIRMPMAVFALCLAAVACGGPDEGEFESADDALSTGSWAAVRRDARGGYVLAPVQQASLKCPDGASRASCHAAVLDLSALGLPGTGLDASIPLAGAGGEQVLVRGFSNRTAGGTFRVTEAHRASHRATAGSTFYVVKGAGPATFQKVNSSSKRTAQVFQIVTTAGNASVRAQAATQVAGAELVVTGGPATVGGKTTFTATTVFVKVGPVAPPAAKACGAGEKALFEQATAGLLYTSESDYPFTVTLRADLGATTPDEGTVRTLAGSSLPANAAIRSQTVDQFFQWIARPDDASMDPYERESTAKYRALRSLLERDLTDVRIYRAGEIQVQVWILGRTACGELVALSTVSIET